MPSEEHLHAIIDELMNEEFAWSLSGMFEEAFGGREEGTYFFHPYLEIMWTLSLNAPVCHLLKPHIYDSINKIIDG